MPTQPTTILHAYQIDAPTNTEFVGVLIAPDGHAVYLHQHVLMGDVVGAVFHVIAPLAVGCVAGILVHFLVFGWRVWRRRKRDGAVYCDQCDYDLTGIVEIEEVPLKRGTRREPRINPENPSCPECGTDLTARRPAIPREPIRFTRRHRVLFGIFLFVLAIALFSHGVGKFRHALLIDRMMWLSPKLGKWAFESNLKYRHGFARGRDVIVEINPDDASIGREVLRHRFRSDVAHISPDGRSIVRFADIDYWSSMLHAAPIDRGGRRFSRVMPDGVRQISYGRLIAFTQSGDAVLLSAVDGRARDRLMEVNLRSGRIIDHHIQPDTPRSNQSAWAVDRFENPTRALKMTPTTRSSLNPVPYFQLFDFPVTTRMPNAHALDTSQVLMMRPLQREPPIAQFHDDDSAIFPGRSLQGLAFVEVSLRDGSVIESIPVPTGVRSFRDGPHMHSPEDRLIFANASREFAVYVYDRRHRRWIARLTYPNDVHSLTLTIGPEARRVLAVGRTNTSDPQCFLDHHQLGKTALFAWDTTALHEELVRLDAVIPFSTP